VFASASRFTGMTTVQRTSGRRCPRDTSDPLTSGILASRRDCPAGAGGDSVRTHRRVGFWYRLVIVVAKPLVWLFTSREWRGAENLPAEGGFIVAANHISELDPFAVGHFLLDHGSPPRFLAKAELFRRAPVKWVLNGAEQIPVSRN